MEQDRDLQLINSINDGDRSAAADLYHRYIGFLTALCSRYVLDRNDVRDILQTSFVKILSSISRFQYRGPGSLKAWMSRIVVNESLKFLQASRKSGDFKEEFMKDSSETGEEPEVDDIPAGELQRMIRELPDGYRSVFNLYVFEELSHKEIASMLGITESTSASQFHRARNMLARKIKEYRNNLNR